MSIRDLVGSGTTQIEDPRTDVEDRIGALMPGDDPEAHPKYEPPCKYINVPFSELLGRLQAGGLTLEDEREVRRAISLQRAFHAEGIVQMKR